MRTLHDLFDKHIYKRTTLTEVIAEEMSKATTEVNQASATIHAHQFMLHMARAKIAALEQWNAAHKDG